MAQHDHDSTQPGVTHASQTSRSMHTLPETFQAPEAPTRSCFKNLPIRATPDLTVELGSSATKLSATPPPLFSLPYEIRLKIYGYLFASFFISERWILRRWDANRDNQILLRLMLVCKHMYFEVPKVVSEIVPVYIPNPHRFPHGVPPLFRNVKHVIGNFRRMDGKWEPSFLFDAVERYQWNRVWLYEEYQTAHPSGGDHHTEETLSRLKDALVRRVRDNNLMRSFAQGVPNVDMRIYLEFHSYRTRDHVAKVCLRDGKLYIEKFAKVNATRDEFGRMAAGVLGFVEYSPSVAA